MKMFSIKLFNTTNRQTEVKYEAFSSANRFHKKLQEYYNSVSPDYRLYYERRSKQYDMDATINKNRVVTFAGQTFAYIAMFLNEPHSINRYYGELIETYKKRIYGKDDMVEPYYIAAYYYYYVDLAIKKNQIDRNFKQFKYHLCLGLRILICGSKIFRGNSREIQKAAEKLNELLHNPQNLSRSLNTVCTCLENTIKASPDIPKDIIFRSRDFTNKFIDEIKKYFLLKLKK